MTNFDDLKLAVEAMSGGKNTVILDDLGMPSIVVPFPKLKYSDVIAGGSQDVLPAFIVDGAEIDVIYQSKYQNIVINNRAYSLPMKDPGVYVTFDAALNACRSKGAGWHLQTNALWAAIALWCKKNGTMPRGNNNYGADYSQPHEKGVPTAKETSGSFRPLRTATGSGPASWYHNYDLSGIADLNGNIWEWCSGMRLQNGEIQIIPNGNAMKIDSNMGATSTEWKAILQDGSLVDPGTPGTLKFDYTATPAAGTGNIELSDTILNPQPDDVAYGYKTFETLTAHTGITVPQILKGLGLFPVDSDHGGDGFYFRNNGERLPFRGGIWFSASNAGVFNLSLSNPRSYSNSAHGFRSAFYGNL